MIKLHPQQPVDHHLPFIVAHQQHPLGLISLGHPLPPRVLASIVVLVAVMETATKVVELPTRTADEGGVQGRGRGGCRKQIVSCLDHSIYA